MIFSSISFIVFFSVVLLGVCLLKGKENKQKFLLLVSYVFLWLVGLQILFSNAGSYSGLVCYGY